MITAGGKLVRPPWTSLVLMISLPRLLAHFDQLPQYLSSYSGGYGQDCDRWRCTHYARWFSTTQAAWFTVNSNVSVYHCSKVVKKVLDSHTSPSKLISEWALGSHSVRSGWSTSMITWRQSQISLEMDLVTQAYWQFGSGSLLWHRYGWAILEQIRSRKGLHQLQYDTVTDEDLRSWNVLLSICFTATCLLKNCPAIGLLM